LPAAVKLIAIFARVRIRGLSTSGSIAALAIGAVCIAAGWTWLIILLAFYVSSTFLSRLGDDARRERAGGIAEKSGDRDVWQVAANGGVFTALALASTVRQSPALYAAAAGAIAASTADTWATEIGTLARQLPRSIVSFKRVATGTSGAVSLPGLAAAGAGALFIAIVATALGWPPNAAIGAVSGGIGGSLIDSVLGATLQRRRWCTMCNVGTERAVHDCGSSTVPAGGIPWLGNDLVNLCCSATGALLGYLTLA
jgi:uncharacterized protein (TIGR00297 family)